MADTERKEYGSKYYFYWNGLLHRRLSVNRSADLLYAWDYKNKRRIAIVYSDWKRNKGIALTTNEVAEIMGRHRLWILNYVREGRIPTPQSTGPRSNNINNRNKLIWSEQDIMNLQELYASFSANRLGKAKTPIPTKAEIRQKLNNSVVFYVKTKDGEYVPTWKETDW